MTPTAICHKKPQKLEITQYPHINAHEVHKNILKPIISRVELNCIYILLMKNVFCIYAVTMATAKFMKFEVFAPHPCFSFIFKIINSEYVTIVLKYFHTKDVCMS